eukprot:CFRG7872T1
MFATACRSFHRTAVKRKVLFSQAHCTVSKETTSLRWQGNISVRSMHTNTNSCITSPQTSWTHLCKWPSLTVGASGGSRVGLVFRRSAGSLFRRGVSTSPKQSPTKKLEKALEQDVDADIRILKKMSKYLWPKGQRGLRIRVVSAVVLLILAKVVNVQVPFLFKQAVDELNLAVGPGSDTALIVFTAAGALIIGYGLARLCASGFSELRSAVFSAVNQHAIRKVAAETFSHMHKLDLNFHLTRKTGALSKAIDRGSRGIQFILSAILFNIVPTALELSLVCGILTYNYGTSYAAVTVGCISVYTGITLMITTWRVKLRQQMNQADNAGGSLAVDSLLNYETVKYFNNEEHETKRYDSCLETYEQAAHKVNTSLALLNWSQNAVFSVSLATMMLMAGHGVQQGTLTVGDLVFVNGLLFQLSLPLNFLGTVYREIRQSLIDMSTLFTLLELHPGIASTPGAPQLKTPIKGMVTFDNVFFGYNAEKDILNGLSMTIPAGQKVAFVGASGCGKSTILRLLFRFYDPKQGNIKLDGQNLSDLDIDSLRKVIGVVPQDTVLFNESLYYNIAYGNINATYDEVIDAAKKADLHHVVQTFPQGYDTQVGERGLKLSGGEKQRVAIARAMLKRPSILLCDEATSALDSETESHIMASLREVSKDRTSIFIAHRLSTVTHCDTIFVLQDGKIVEHGTHMQLLERKGVYEGLWERQHSPDIQMSTADLAQATVKPKID